MLLSPQYAAAFLTALTLCYCCPQWHYKVHILPTDSNWCGPCWRTTIRNSLPKYQHKTCPWSGELLIPHRFCLHPAWGTDTFPSGRQEKYIFFSTTVRSSKPIPTSHTKIKSQVCPLSLIEDNWKEPFSLPIIMLWVTSVTSLKRFYVT